MESVLDRTSGVASLPEPRISSLVDRLMTIHHGTRDGYYEVLADHGSMTYPELAYTVGTSAESARNWLETQVALGVLTADTRLTPAWERRYQMPAARASFLLDLEDPFVPEYSEAA